LLKLPEKSPVMLLNKNEARTEKINIKRHTIERPLAKAGIEKINV